MPLALRWLAISFLALVLLVGIDAELYRNEGLRAGLAAEALATGNWLVPTLHGEPHLTKPPGMTLLILLCSLPFGEVTPVSARLPSVLAGLATAVLLGYTLRRLQGDLAGWLAALLLPCACVWLDRAPSAEIDLVQLAWVSGSILCLFHAVEDDSPTWWLAAMLCVAGGLFTKWTAPAFFYLTALPWLAWRGKLRLLCRPAHLFGLALVVVVTLGWLVWVAQAAGWPVLLDTVGREALLRFSPGHHPRPYPWGELITFPLVFLAGCLPVGLLALPACRPGFAGQLDERQRAFWQLCQAWLWIAVLFWTLVPGHRPRHLLPAQPALAALAALVCARAVADTVLKRNLVVALLAGWLLVKLAHGSIVMPARALDRRPSAGGRELARLVSGEERLYLWQVKDEGLLFYARQAARRLADPAELPAGACCLVGEGDWQRWPAPVTAHVVGRLIDGQGDPLVLVRRAER